MLKTAANHAAHFMTEALIGLLGLGAMAGCVLAWRLSQGPIDVTALAQREQAALTGAGARLTVGHAALAWEGFHDPTSAVDIRLSDIAVVSADDTTLLRIPFGRVDISFSQLLLGRFVPRGIEVDDATVNLRRTLDGTVLLDLDSKPHVPGDQARGGNEIISELARPARPSDNRQPDLPWLSQLHRVRVRNAHVTLHDAALGVVWQADNASADLKRGRDGGVVGDSRLDLAIGHTHATLSAHAELTADGTRVTASTTDINPAELAAASPAFAAIGAVDAPLRASLDARLGPDLAPRTARMTWSLGAGTLKSGSIAIPVQSASATLDITPAHASLQGFRIEMAQTAGTTGSPPTLQIGAEATRTLGRIAANFTVDIDRVDFADLGAYWPAGTGGGARDWIINNVTAGTARDGHVMGSIEAASDFSAFALKTLTGRLDAEDMTLWWLRPISPLEHADARLLIESPDALRIMVRGGQQKALHMTGGSMRISGLMAKDQVSQIDVGLAGALPDALSLLAQPRLDLLSRLPFPVESPSGTVTAHLAIRLPLDARVTMDGIGISAEAELADVHLGKVAAGRDLDDGQMTMNVDTDGLVLAGDATLGGIPSTLSIDMDFRSGASGQVVQHVVARGIAQPADLERAGLPNSIVTGGTAAVALDYTAYRGNTAELAVDADLTQAALNTPFSWTKAAGLPASVAARLTLSEGRITGIDGLRADGPGLKLLSRVTTEAGRMHVLHLDHLDLGRTDMHGQVTLPASSLDPWRVTLEGSLLDLSGYLDSKSTAQADTADDERRGPRWQADLSFGRVILAKDENVRAVRLSAASDGLHITRATVTADANRIAASITPTATGRHLAVDAGDAGAVLLAANVFDNIRGGHLTVDANYNDTLPHAPLSGTATLEKFRLLDAPAVGRLLKAMTFYGAVDLLRGPGLGFAKAVAPFTWQQRVLHLDNARVFSASLGLTAQGDIDLRARNANLTGTIVPAYFFNQLLGNLPVLGKLFSPEKGGGVFAARYSIRGKLADPKIGVNPLSALTPGFLRGVFGLL